ncbi:NitT/TauT family transport system permease protein [Arcanobacterium wilhelmae]|uniref:NitT/TauT family transport system permease protein n=1 Tax=Arcanobacterium wilhelmae TaxID=1803177 RepID=A0ABT9N8J6_9ACTO|nr:ABC transporter permease [Arcanobacterium wilhelmae]MDP9800023.1 NitT/TauT family transport system permease protein [Arcanobacterium wilhelmae]WFN89520.1 ABC transporter permease [Arcanobacterium wilhelmae]
MRRWIAPIAFGVGSLFVWWIVAFTGMVGAWALPNPIEVARRLVAGFAAGIYLPMSLHTVSEAIFGSLIAAGVGIPIGFAIANWKIVSEIFEPYLAASQAIPAVAVAPILVTWVGYGTVSIVTLVVVMVIFPIIVSTAVGARRVDPEIMGAARVDGAGSLKLWWHIQLPLASPGILAGVRTGSTLSMTGAVVGEMVIGGGTGLGINLVSAQNLGDVPGMFALITILAVIAIAIYLVVRGVERNLARVLFGE